MVKHSIIHGAQECMFPGSSEFCVPQFRDSLFKHVVFLGLQGPLTPCGHRPPPGNHRNWFSLEGGYGSVPMMKQVTMSWVGSEE
jgi:hypothetical protein